MKLENFKESIELKNYKQMNKIEELDEKLTDKATQAIMLNEK